MVKMMNLINNKSEIKGQGNKGVRLNEMPRERWTRIKPKKRESFLGFYRFQVIEVKLNGNEGGIVCKNINL